jgi:hypothetical protein
MLVGVGLSGVSSTAYAGCGPVPGWAKTFVEKWRVAWEQSAKRNSVSKLRVLYHPAFHHNDAKMNRAQYMKRLEKGAKKYASWSIRVQKLRVSSCWVNGLSLSFLQHYSRPGYKDVGTKTLIMGKHKGKWLIKVEYWRALPLSKKVRHARCRGALRKGQKRSAALRALLRFPSYYFVLDDDGQKNWVVRGRTPAQRIRWMARCVNYKKACWPTIREKKGVIAYSTDCTQGPMNGTVFSYIGGKVPFALVYLWSPSMTSSYTFLARVNGAWKKTKGAKPPAPTKQMAKWMNAIKNYPDGCNYRMEKYSVNPSKKRLIRYLGAACNGDPPPDIKVGEYKWTNGRWKAVWLRKTKPRFYRNGDVLRHR